MPYQPTYFRIRSAIQTQLRARVPHYLGLMEADLLQPHDILPDGDMDLSCDAVDLTGSRTDRGEQDVSGVEAEMQMQLVLWRVGGSVKDRTLQLELLSAAVCMALREQAWLQSMAAQQILGAILIGTNDVAEPDSEQVPREDALAYLLPISVVTFSAPGLDTPPDL